MFEHLAAVAAGYLFALLVGHWAIGSLMRSAGTRSQSGSGHPAAIGFLERTLYLASWQLGVRWFIGVWMGLKVIGNWKRWNEDPSTPGPIPGRSTFNRFLLGAGTSVGFAVAGALITDLLDHNDWAEALVLAIVVVGSTMGLGWFLGRVRE